MFYTHVLIKFNTDLNLHISTEVISYQRMLINDKNEQSLTNKIQ